MAQHQAVITDYTFDDLDIERKLLEGVGLQLGGPEDGKDPSSSFPW